MAKIRPLTYLCVIDGYNKTIYKWQPNHSVLHVFEEETPNLSNIQRRKGTNNRKRKI